MLRRIVKLIPGCFQALGAVVVLALLAAFFFLLSLPLMAIYKWSWDYIVR